MESVISGIKENNLKLTLAFGIGLHHAGLHERDRKMAEELFVNQKIQVCTLQLISLVYSCRILFYLYCVCYQLNYFNYFKTVDFD